MEIGTEIDIRELREWSPQSYSSNPCGPLSLAFSSGFTTQELEALTRQGSFFVPARRETMNFKISLAKSVCSLLDDGEEDVAFLITDAKVKSGLLITVMGSPRLSPPGISIDLDTERGPIIPIGYVELPENVLLSIMNFRKSFASTPREERIKRAADSLQRPMVLQNCSQSHVGFYLLSHDTHDDSKLIDMWRSYLRFANQTLSAEYKQYFRSHPQVSDGDFIIPSYLSIPPSTMDLERMYIPPAPSVCGNKECAHLAHPEITGICSGCTTAYCSRACMIKDKLHTCSSSQQHFLRSELSVYCASSSSTTPCSSSSSSWRHSKRDAYTTVGCDHT